MSLDDDLVRLASRLSRVTGMDERTGLANLRLLVRDLDREIARGRRSQPGIHLFVVRPDADVDPGEFATELSSTAREEDVVARLGDEQFAVLVVNAPVDEAERIGNAIRNRLRALSSVSVGWRPVIGDQLTHADATEIVRQAVAAADSAREEGGDRVVKWRPARPNVH